MRNSRTSGSRVAVGIVSAIVLASGVNTALSLLAQAFGADPARLAGLQPRSYLTLTTIGVVVAAAAWLAVRTWSQRSDVLLARLVPTVLGLSLLADIPFFFADGVSPVGVVALMLMHVAVAAVAVPTFRKVLPLDRPVSPAEPAVPASAG